MVIKIYDAEPLRAIALRPLYIGNSQNPMPRRMARVKETRMFSCCISLEDNAVRSDTERGVAKATTLVGGKMDEGSVVDMR